MYNLRPLKRFCALIAILGFGLYLGVETHDRAVRATQCPVIGNADMPGFVDYVNGTWFDESGRVVGYGTDDEGWEIYASRACAESS